MIRKTTSIKVDSNLWKKVKLFCVENDMDISEYIETLIEIDMKIKKHDK